MLQPRSAAMSAAVALVALALVPSTASGQFVFAPDASPAEIAHYTAAYERAFPSDDRYVVTTRWPGNQGEGANVFFSFVPDGVLIPAPPGVSGGELPSVTFSTLDALFLNLGGRSRWLNAIALPESPGAQVSPLSSGGVDYWNDFTGLSILLIRRPAVAGSNPLDLWDDGAAWGAPGPNHPPPVTTVLTVSINTVQLASATITTSADSSSLVVNPQGGSTVTFNLLSAANDTLGELAAQISTITGLTASLPGGVAASTPSASLAGGQSQTLNAGNTSGNFLSGAPVRGDIRLAMRPLPASILAFATAPSAGGGDIILNSTIDWRQGTNARVLRNTVGRAVGQAIGLDLVCPNDKTKLMEPILNTTLDGIGFDDVRGLFRLYGDAANLSSLGFSVPPGLSLEPNDDPTIAVGSEGGPWNLGSFGLLTRTDRSLGLSLDDVTDRDFFAFNLGSVGQTFDFDVKITVSPLGGTYSIGANAPACTGTPFNASAVFDPRVNLFTSTGDPLGIGSAASAAPFTVFLNTAGAGVDEIVNARLQSGGTFIIGIEAVGNPGSQSQIYNVRIELVNRNLADGVPLGPIVADAVFIPGPTAPEGEPQPRLDGYNGHGALTFGLAQGSSLPHFYNTNYLGTRARYATVEADFPDANHIAFGGRPITLVRWEGVNPAVDTIGNHPTATTGAGTGITIPRGNSYFRGVAPEAELVSSAVATQLLPSGAFLTSPESVYYALFAISDPALAPSVGLAGPATVINSSWGSLGDQRGDSQNALAYDAVVSTFGVTAVCSAGNAGLIDNTDDCGFNAGGGGDGDDNLPGKQFVGSRTIGAPASAFNVLTVGAAGKGIYDEPFPPPPTDGGGGGGGGGGDGGRPGGDRGVIGGPPGGPGGGPPDPTGVALNTIPNFSSKGPVDTFNYSRNAPATQFNTRPGVHIVAAGTGLIARAIDPDLYDTSPEPCAQYGLGHEPTDFLGLPALDLASNSRFEATQGTSFAAPIVAGAVALLQDYGLAQVPPKNIDSLVMRSVLMTSAVKMPGWSNNGNPASPQDDRDGRSWTRQSEIVSTQITGVARPLDLAQGAGLLSIPQAFSIYALGTLTDSPLTDPKVPSQTPAGELEQPTFPGNPNSLMAPGTGSSQWTAEELAELKRLLPVEPSFTSVETERILREMREINKGAIYYPNRPDFTDPNLTPGSGGKSGAGTFDDREPFLGGGSTPGGFQGDGPAPTKPVEIGAPIFGGAVGWDIGNLGIKALRLPSGGRVGGVIDYVIPITDWPIGSPEDPSHPPNTPGTRDYLTATLVWNRHVKVRPPVFGMLDNPRVGELVELELEDLNLELFLTVDGNVFDGQEPVAFSRTTFSNIEHLHYQLQTSGIYVLRVTYATRNYNFFRNMARGGVPFAVSWAWSDQLIRNVAAPSTLPAPPVPPPALGLPLLNAVLFHYGARLGEAGYNAVADVNQDGVVNIRDLMWVLSRLAEAPPRPRVPHVAEQ